MTRLNEQYIQEAIRRIVAVFLVVGMNAAGLSAVGETFGYYNDTERSDGNLFAAHMLDFRLEPTSWTPPESEADLFYGNTGFRDIEIIDEGTSTDFYYVAHADNMAGDVDYCDDLNIKAEYDSTTYYNGALTAFSSAPDADTLGTWHYTLTSPVNHQNKICSFDIVYDGWQKELPGYMLGGYYDTEKVENTISSWGLRINKVYYDVAPSLGSEPANEWIEIFNQTDVPLEFAEWELCDNTSCDVMPTSTPAIPAGGYAVISATSTTWDYWNIPDEVVKIEIDDNAIGGGLANDGDHLLLKRPDGVVIDAVGWGDDTAVWDPAAPLVQEGGMLARNPSGTDTDTPADWSELLPPSVDMLNPDENDNSQTWYWTYTYTIEWNAENHNGPDGDLSIDLSYIRDINADEVIDDGDTEHVIATGIGNTGEYDWTVPSGFVGNIWIKLVAYGPENPMVHAFTFSGRVWDPFPIEAMMDEPLMTPVPAEDEPMPEMEIVGNNPALVALGSSYSDMGARVLNASGADMSVHTEGTVDTAVAGVYEIVYTAEADGYELTGTRLVVVYEGEEVPDAASYAVPAIEIVPEESLHPAEAGSAEGSDVESGDTMMLGDDGTDGASDSGDDSDGAGAEDGAADDGSATASENNEDNEEGDASESGEGDEDGEDLSPAEAGLVEEDEVGEENDETASQDEESESGESAESEEQGTDTAASDESEDVETQGSEETVSENTEEEDSSDAEAGSVEEESEEEMPGSAVEEDEQEALREEDTPLEDQHDAQTTEDVPPTEDDTSQETHEESGDSSEHESDSDTGNEPDTSVEDDTLSDNGEETA